MAELITEDTIDDLLHSAMNLVLTSGQEVEPTKGATTEARAVTLELQNPRARLSRSLERGRVVSPLGELCWYLAGQDDADFITYYLPPYLELAEGGVLPGAYGPRLFGVDAQVGRVIRQLRDKPASRRAVVSVLRSSDFERHHDDLPCTVSLQFLLRDGRLDLIAHMRSSDLFTGFIHDVFCFTMIQELVAADLGVELGTYTHFAGSLHIYAKDLERVHRYLDEGWHSPGEMPAMPPGSPWDGVTQLLAAEAALREHGSTAFLDFPSQKYWCDLALMLVVFAHLKERDFAILTRARSKLSHEFYYLYLEDKIANAEARGDRG